MLEHERRRPFSNPLYASCGFADNDRAIASASRFQLDVSSPSLLRPIGSDELIFMAGYLLDRLTH